MIRVGFVTCVELGLACIEEIYGVGGTIDLAVTLPDDRARTKSGRVYLDDFCRLRSIELLKVPNINDPEAVAAVRRSEIDWLCIIGWSQIARSEVLRSPRMGSLGMHPTLLPEGRGRAAIPWAILKGLSRTGVTLFQLDEGVDTGPILGQVSVDLAPDETATTLYGKVEEAHRSLIRDCWPRLLRGELTARPQDETRATVWPGRTPEDGRITLDMSVDEVDRLVRATTRPYPGAFLDLAGTRVRVWAGRRASGHVSPAAGRYLIHLSDGAFVATDFELEALPLRLTPG